MRRGCGWPAISVMFCLVAAGCSSDPDSSAADTTSAVAAAPATTTTAAPPSTTTAAATTSTEPGPAWEKVVGDETCMCADGSEWNMYVRPADPTKVVLFFQGGGACFTGGMCAFDSNSYNVSLAGDAEPSTYDGIFDFENPENPFTDHSFVFVPYCTGDVHIGDNTNDYGDGVVVEHNGMPNGRFALNELLTRFPDAAEVFVTGSSAGGVPTPLFAGLVADELPSARVTALADGSGAYPSVPAINAGIGALWGTFGARPDWPEAATQTPESWSIPGLFAVAGLHNPKIAMARHDHAFDNVQSSFAGLAGIDASDLVQLIDQNEDEVEAAGVEIDSYVAPGDDHTILGMPEVYTQTVEGVRFIDWLTALVTGDPVDDVHCTTCT